VTSQRGWRVRYFGPRVATTTMTSLMTFQTPPAPLAPREIERVVRAALDEDAAGDDVTTRWTVPAEAVARAEILFRQAGVVAGSSVIQATFAALDRRIEFLSYAEDGSTVAAGTVVARVKGPARAILTAERVALNFLQRMSGIATITAAFVRAVDGTGAQIYDTRKTAPGLRLIDKYSVELGGGKNYRKNLSAMVLIKENHIRAAGGVVEAIQRARAGMKRDHHEVKLDVEVQTLDEFEAALQAGADCIMLDNMVPEQLLSAVTRARGVGPNRPILEASGNVSLDTVRTVAETGVDLISIGRLTHSAPALDVSLLVRESVSLVERASQIDLVQPMQD
jgi:nicotinate-nucleotide pyrophosphorylase (carboxylating)